MKTKTEIPLQSVQQFAVTYGLWKRGEPYTTQYIYTLLNGRNVPNNTDISVEFKREMIGKTVLIRPLVKMPPVKP